MSHAHYSQVTAETAESDPI